MSGPIPVTTRPIIYESGAILRGLVMSYPIRCARLLAPKHAAAARRTHRPEHRTRRVESPERLTDPGPVEGREARWTRPGPVDGCGREARGRRKPMDADGGLRFSMGEID